MKILFAADMSFNYIHDYPGNEAVKIHMAKAAEKFAEADFSEDKTGIKIYPYHFNFDGIRLLDGEELEFFNKYISYLSEVISDDKKLGRFFDAWCAKYGYDYAHNHMYFEDEYVNGNPWDIAGKRNLFTCEAHSELLKGFLNLCYENRVEEAKEYLEEIEIIQSLKLK